MKWVVAGVVAAWAAAGVARADGEIKFSDYVGLAKGQTWVCELTEEWTGTYPTRAEYDGTSSEQWTLLVISGARLQPPGRVGLFVERAKGSGTGKNGRYEWTFIPPDHERIQADGGRERTNSRAVTPPFGPRLAFAGELQLDVRGKALRSFPIHYETLVAAVFALWPELPTHPLTVGQSFSVTRPVGLHDVPAKDMVLQVRVAKLEGETVTLELRGVRPVTNRELEETGDFEYLLRYPGAKGQLTLQGKTRVRRGEPDWLDGELESQLHLAADGKTVARLWARHKLKLTPRPKPDLSAWVERILEHGIGSE